MLRLSLAALAGTAASRAAAASPPNVLFIVSDDLRPELGVYGGEARRSDYSSEVPSAFGWKSSLLQQRASAN